MQQSNSLMSITLCENCKRPIGQHEEEMLGICTRCENKGYTLEDAKIDYSRRKQQEAVNDNNK